MILGDHTIYYGDFFETYFKVPKHSVDLVVTDPPYGLFKPKQSWDALIDFYRFAGILRERVKLTGTVAVFCSPRMLKDIRICFELYFKYRFMEVWEKPSAMAKPKDRPKPNIEIVCVFDGKKAKKDDHVYNWKDVAEVKEPYRRVNRNRQNTTMITPKREVDENPTGHRHPSSVLYLPNRPAMTRQEKEGVTHPQQKSLFGTERLIRLLSNPGDVILDAFMGSGTAVVATARCGRVGLGFEKELRFFNQAKSRLERELEEDHVPVTP